MGSNVNWPKVLDWFNFFLYHKIWHFATDCINIIQLGIDLLYIHSSMALEPICTPRPLFPILDLSTIGRAPWMKTSLYLHTGHKHRINAHKHICLDWDSNSQSHCLCARRPLGHCDRQYFTYRFKLANAPSYISNVTLHNDLRIPYVREV
jgi:hypothetical protein